MLVAAALITACLIALASGKVPPVVAFATTLTLAGILGVAPTSELLSGLSNTSVITVAAMLVIAAGVVHTGVVSRATRRILGNANTLRAALTKLLIPVGLASSVMNNTPIIAMTIPAAQELEQTRRIPARWVYMPIAFAAALGGTITVIGTSSNLLIAGIAEEEGVKVNLFMFAPVAVPTFLAGVAVLILTVRKLLPQGEQAPHREHTWQAEFTIQNKALIAGRTLQRAGLEHARDYQAVRVQRADQTLPLNTPLQVGDRVTYKANKAGVKALWASPRWGSKEHRLYEATLAPGVSGNLAQIDASEHVDILAAQGVHEDLHASEARPGGHVIVTAKNEEHVAEVAEISLVVDAAGRAPQAGKTTTALSILAVVVAVLAWGGIASVWVAGAGALAMVFTRVITVKAAARALNWNLLGVLAGAVGLGAIATESGITAQVARWVAQTAGGNPVVLTLLVASVALVLAMLVTTAAAVTMLAPVVLSASAELAVAPEPLLALLGVAAILSFVNPYSNQSFLLVMDPGRYRFQDYAKVGAGVTIVTLSIAVGATLAWLSITR